MNDFVKEVTEGEMTLPITDEFLFNQMLDRFVKEDTNGIEAVNEFIIGFSDTEESYGFKKLIYMKVEALSIGRRGQPNFFNEPIYNQWNEFMTEWREQQAPEGLQICWQNAGPAWAFMVTENAFLTNVLQGMGISISVAFIILTLATMNIVITMMTILTVIFICASVISVMVFYGWQMGVSESTAMVIIIGFSVDYVCHLAAHYVHSKEKKRYERTTESVRDMGVSIFSGGITTLGSGIFLLGGTIQFFPKFGLVIITTVAFSLSFAFFFFLSMCHAFGPEDNCGKLPFSLWIKKCRQRR